MFIQTLARILAGKIDLRVVSDDKASTFFIARLPNGSLELHLATRLIEATGGRADAVGDVVRGALAHEALGHGRHTDFDAAFPQSPFGKCLANAFEDVRIEKLAPTVFPGARSILATMVETLVRECGFWKKPAAREWQSSLIVGLLRKYRTEILGQPLDEATTNAILAQASAVLGPTLFAKVDALAREACCSGSTGEVNACAERIVALLAQQSPDKQDQPGGSERGKDENGDDGDGAGGGDGPPGNTGEGEAESSGPPEAETGSKNGRGRAAAPFDPDAVCDVDVETALDEVVGDGCKVTRQYDYVPKDAMFRGYGDNQANGFASRIACGLEESLRSITQDADDFISDRGRLDTTRLPAIAGRFTDFGFVDNERDGAGIDTELMVMFDNSSSMASLDTKFLQAAIYSTLMALGRFQPDLGLSLAFFDHEAQVAVRPGIHITPMVARKASASYTPRGSTSWASSARALMPMLVTSRRRRKTLLTVTDGKLGSDATRSAVIHDYRASGVECRFVSVDEALPADCLGRVCSPTQEGFSTALRKSVLECIPPDCM